MPVGPQEITVELIEKQSRLGAKSLSVVIDSLVTLLSAVDAKMWTVNAPRYRWVVKAIQMQSPLKMTLEAVPTTPEPADADVVGTTLRGLTMLNRGAARRPKFFDDRGLTASRHMVSVYGDGVLAMSLSAPLRPEFSPSTRIASAVDKITSLIVHPFEAYGSIDGRLRRATVDDRPEHEVHELQIINRETDGFVTCRVTPDQARSLARMLGRRVVLFGTVRYNAAHEPQRITVEDFEQLETEPLPTLEDIHALGLNLTGGEDAADYIARLRGNG